MKRPPLRRLVLHAGLGVAALASACVRQTRSAAQSPPASLPSGNVRLEGVVAIVNDDVITESEFERVLAAAKQTFGSPDAERWKAYRRAKLRELIEARLYEQAARRRENAGAAIEEGIRQRGSKRDLFDWIEQQGKT